MWGLLLGLLGIEYASYKIDKARNNANLNPDGDWVDKSTLYEEEWVWKEPRSKSYYINVVQKGEGYLLEMRSRPKRVNVLDVVHCSDYREAEIALNTLKSLYQVYGPVSISTLDRETGLPIEV